MIWSLRNSAEHFKATQHIAHNESCCSSENGKVTRLKGFN